MVKLQEILDRVKEWPESDQQELVAVARDIEARRVGSYQASSEELEAIDEALGQIARGKVASKKEIEAAFAKFHKA